MKTSIRTEFVAGFTTFLTMSYIIFVNPAILSTQGTGMAFSGVMTATVLLSFLLTLAMGLYARLPFAVAPGMGINAFFTFSLILGEKIPWPTALGMIFWSGVFFLIISVTPLREKLAESLPDGLKTGATVGIGLFLMLIGLKNSGVIVADPATFVTMGKLQGQTLLAVFGFVVILALLRWKSSAAFLVGIGAVTIGALALGYTKFPTQFFAMPDFRSVFFKLDIMGALRLSLVPAIISIVFTDLFDSISTFVGVARAGGLVDGNGNPIRMKEALIVDSFATLLAGLFGTSSGTAFIESAAGIEAGGRTGMTAVFAALFFLPCFFIAPLVALVPAFATGPVLICVGLLMFQNVFEIKTKHFEDWIPAVLTVVLIPLTFSITKGLMWGLCTQFLLYVLAGRWRDLTVAMWILGLLSGTYLYFS